MPYDEALELQRTLVEERKADNIPDTLLLLEHPHILTLGVRKGGGRVNILATSQTLDALGVTVHDAGRGGDVTYHGPGQLVGYPIIDLRPDRQDVHRYVRDVEEVIIRCCAEFGITAQRLDGLTGAWVADPDRGLAKVAAIGVRIARWITSHGFALNVHTDLSFFDLIVPCGIRDRGVTSMHRLFGRMVSMSAVETSIERHFASVFERAVVSDSTEPQPTAPQRDFANAGGG